MVGAVLLYLLHVFDMVHRVVAENTIVLLGHIWAVVHTAENVCPCLHALVLIVTTGLTCVGQIVLVGSGGMSSLVGGSD